MASFNPLTGIRSFLTRTQAERTGEVEGGFNPLTGIRSFLTRSATPCPSHPSSGFNPLTGIRSFLTVDPSGHYINKEGTFQSPHGDSFFSDFSRTFSISITQEPYRFNPLTGIRSFLTMRVWSDDVGVGYSCVSIPSRGFVLF